MNEIILELSALGIATFCFVDCLKNRTGLYLPFPKGLIAKAKDQHFTYLTLLFVMMISALSSVLEVSMTNFWSYRSVPILFLINQVYFLFHTAMSLVFMLYIMNMTDAAANKGLSFFITLFVPFAVSELLVIINPFTKLIFYVDEECVYHRGSLMWTLYAMAFIYVVFAVSFFTKNRKNIKRLDRVAAIILISIAVIGIAAQGIFSIMVELFFEAIAFFGFMLLLEEESYRELTGRKGRSRRSFIYVIALTFLIVVILNINLIYHAGTDQTGRIGEVQTSSLKGEMQQIITESESSVLHYSMGLEQFMIDDPDLRGIKDFIQAQQDHYVDATDGNCFSVYAAAKDWTIIPGFDFGDDYHATERVWYVGAKNHPGEVYLSDPYIDADTGDLCITFSYLLSDGETVAAMDYTLSRIQDIVSRMGDSEDQFAMIVTGGGTIVGCTETGLQGKDLLGDIPEYADVFRRVGASSEHKSFRTRIDGHNRIIFSDETNNGWKLILSADYSKFYAKIYNQMALLGAIDLLMVAVIIVFYMVSINNQEKAEDTLHATKSFISSLTDDLMNPLNDIMRVSDMYTHQGVESPEALRSIGEASHLLKERMENLFAYSSILRTDSTDESVRRSKKHRDMSASSRNMRNGITGILIVALLIGLSLCLAITARWGSARIGREVDGYNSEVTVWVQKQQSILGMFADVIAADPAVLDDYDKAVKWLDDIVGQYSEMTVAYLANPYNREYPVIMNNGWVGGPDFKVEERQWYIDTERSGTGSSISRPYYDAQTGLYCITISQTVYSVDGQFLGIFGIDCLLDRLIDVLDDSYTDDSYAFLVDQDGTIINHPYKEYEISADNVVNIADTEYADVYSTGSSFWMSDYDGRIVACRSRKSDVSGFTVIVVQSWWSIYGNVLIMVSVFLITIVASIIAVARMINRFIIWQEDSNRKLVEAVNSAVAAEKAKSRFLAQMSHEIRTPINTVLGMNEMIMRESSDTAIREYAGNIRSAGKNLLGLINSILDFSKIEEGKMEIIPVRYDTAMLIGNMINSVSKRAKDKGLDFDAHVDGDLPSALFGDDMRVTQVAVNLLTNAVKYTKEGRIDLYVTGRHNDDGDFTLGVRVKDTGMGIKSEDIDRLFESFTRLEETRNRNIEGTGLGMAIVNRLLDMMGSKLSVTSVYGEGSEFSFEVKQDVVDATPIGDYEQKAREAMRQDDEDTYLYAPDAKVLVVDDNNMNLIVIQSLLKINGIKPDTAASGEDALALLKDKKYDIVMLDHMMPDMDGIETLVKAKEDDLIPEGCAVIALTANAVVGARDYYLKEGFDDYLSKPIDVGLMEEQLARFLPKDMVTYRNKSDKDAADDGKESFAKACEGNIRELEEALAAKDYKRYADKMKQIKADCKAIGEKDLSKGAAALEISAKTGAADAVKNQHPAFIAKYRDVAKEMTDSKQ